jgi:4-hydroxy-4-methyl-2-oxoglutarate aldolase
MSPEERAAWTEYLRTVDTPTLSNAIEMLKVRPRSAGFTPLALRCLFPEMGRMCGYAVTAHVETVTSTGPEEEKTFLELFAAVDAAPKPAVVVMQEIGAHSDWAAHSGEIMATMFQRLGAVGLVSDSGVRDLPEVRALGFHYFARGAVASHASFRIVRSNEPVHILGLVVRPGDLLHGDENGLLLAPEVDPAELRAAVAAIRSREGELMKFIRSPGFTLDKLSLRGFFD